MQIYLDNAATTKMRKAAIDAMLPYMYDIYGNPSSMHSAGQKANAAAVNARRRIAKLLGCEAGEITFTSGGSEADNQAIISAARIGEKSGKKHIVSAAFEHSAVLRTLEKLEREGFDITLLKVNGDGIVTPGQAAEAIRKDTCLVTIMYANNEIGTLQPIREIGSICRNCGVLFHTDAVQAAGSIDINVREQNIDMLSLSAHKFHGPKGIGALYARKGIELTCIIEGGTQERGKRAGTENIPAIMGMAAAFEESCSSISEDTKRITAMRDRLISGLSEIPYSVLNGDAKKRLPGNVNFSFEGIDGEALLLLLDQKGVCASSGSACMSGSHGPSHVLLAIGRTKDTAVGSLRLSLSRENTDEEIEYTIHAVKEAVEYLRSVFPAR